MHIYTYTYSICICIERKTWTDRVYPRFSPALSIAPYFTDVHKFKSIFSRADTLRVPDFLRKFHIWIYCMMCTLYTVYIFWKVKRKISWSLINRWYRSQKYIVVLWLKKSNLWKNFLSVIYFMKKKYIYVSRWDFYIYKE